MSKQLNEDGLIPGQHISPADHMKMMAKQRVKENEAKRVKVQPAKKQPAKKPAAKKTTTKTQTAKNDNSDKE